MVAAQAGSLSFSGGRAASPACPRRISQSNASEIFHRRLGKNAHYLLDNNSILGKTNKL
jgi:hypothetical protein